MHVLVAIQLILSAKVNGPGSIVAASTYAKSARGEAAHYAMMYEQDGPVEVRVYAKRLIPADAVEVSRG